MDSRQIVISKGAVSVAMPVVKNVAVGGKEVSKPMTMASGKIVKDVLGHRPTVTAVWDWVPAGTLAALCALLKQGGFFSVKYPSPGGTARGSFSIEFPTVGIFAFQKGAPVWHDVTLSMESNEVI